MLIFGAGHLLSLKNGQMCSQKQFLAVFSENTVFFFSKKLSNKKNSASSDRKGYIHFWCKITLYRSHSDIPLLTHFLRQRSSPFFMFFNRKTILTIRFLQNKGIFWVRCCTFFTVVYWEKKVQDPVSSFFLLILFQNRIIKNAFFLLLYWMVIAKTQEAISPDFLIFTFTYPSYQMEGKISKINRDLGRLLRIYSSYWSTIAPTPLPLPPKKKQKRKVDFLIYLNFTLKINSLFTRCLENLLVQQCV